MTSSLWPSASGSKVVRTWSAATSRSGAVVNRSLSVLVSWESWSSMSLPGVSDASIGVEHQGGAGRDDRAALLVEDITHAEGRVDRRGRRTGALARGGHQGGQMSGGADRHRARVGRDHQVAAGDQLVRDVEVGDGRVEGLHELAGLHTGLGQGVCGGTQLAHDGGGFQPASHHVADQDADAAATSGTRSNQSPTRPPGWRAGSGWRSVSPGMAGGVPIRLRCRVRAMCRLSGTGRSARLRPACDR